MEATKRSDLPSSFWIKNYDLILIAITIVAGGTGMILRSEILFSLGFIGIILFFIISAIPKNQTEKKDERIIGLKHRASSVSFYATLVAIGLYRLACRYFNMAPILPFGFDVTIWLIIFMYLVYSISYSIIKRIQ